MHCKFRILGEMSGLALRGLLTQVCADNRSSSALDDSACRIATYPTEHFDLDCIATSDTSYLLRRPRRPAKGMSQLSEFLAGRRFKPYRARVALCCLAAWRQSDTVVEAIDGLLQDFTDLYR